MAVMACPPPQSIGSGQPAGAKFHSARSYQLIEGHEQCSD